MKKILFITLLAISFAFASCTSTGYCVSAKKLQTQIEKTNEDYNELGFMFTGMQTNSQNNVYVAGYNYNQYTGYNSVMANNIVYKDTYTFKDENQNSVRFTVQYSIRCNGGLYNVEICDCETNKYDLYNKLCNNSNLNKINYLPNDYKYEYYDEIKTYGLILGIGVVCLIPLLIF